MRLLKLTIDWMVLNEWYAEEKNRDAFMADLNAVNLTGEIKFNPETDKTYDSWCFVVPPEDVTNIPPHVIKRAKVEIILTPWSK